jgi:hypothetical protein
MYIYSMYIEHYSGVSTILGDVEIEDREDRRQGPREAEASTHPHPHPDEWAMCVKESGRGCCGEGKGKEPTCGNAADYSSDDAGRGETRRPRFHLCLRSAHSHFLQLFSWSDCSLH